MYPENPNMIYASYLPLTEDTTLGKVRETFFINQMQNADYPVFYSDIGDFSVNDFIFEIGEKNKSMKQIKIQRTLLY